MNTVIAVCSGLQCVSLLLFLFITKRIQVMSASTDSLAASVSALVSTVTAATVAIADLKGKVSDPADVAAIDKAVADIQVATKALAEAVA